jgi:hypothetical protein
MSYSTDNNSNILQVPPWLDAARMELASMIKRGQLPQSLLVHGSSGTGRRYLSLWLATQLLGVPGGRFAQFAEAEVGQEVAAELGHPDLMVVQPPPDKLVIQVESVRELIGFLQLRSHQGGARVAMIWPAESMTAAAANSLLKTLEEPPSGSTIVLVAAVPARLPPTVLSRTTGCDCHPPARVQALEWLAEQGDAPDWAAILVAGGAPLPSAGAAPWWLFGQIAQYAKALKLRQRRESAASVAKVGLRKSFSWRWLYLQATASVEQAMTTTGRGSGHKPLQKPMKPTNIHALFERLSEAESLFHNRFKAVGVEIQLAALLQRWYGETAARDEN